MTKTLKGSELQTEERSYWLDNLRIVAMALVIAVHVKLEPMGDSSQRVYDTIRPLLSVCVPLFLLISGSLVIKPSNTFERMFPKAVRLSLLLLAWGFIYIAYDHFVNSPYNIKGIVGVFLFSVTPGAAHLWFLYCIVGLYLITPIISQNFHFYSLISWLVFCLVLSGVMFETKMIPNGIPFSDPLVRVSSTPPWLAMWIGYLPYFMLGKVLAEIDLQFLRKHWLVLLLTLFGFASWIVYTQVSTYLSLPIFTLSAGLFVSAKLFWGNPIFGPKYTLLISNCIFGIYLIHMLFRNIARDFGLYDLMLSFGGGNNPVLLVVFQTGLTACIFAVSLILVIILRKTPAKVLLS